MARKAIMKQVVRDYADMGGYAAVGDIWGISSGLAWKIINEDYWPKSKDIRDCLIQRARQRGMLIKRKGRKRDLLTFSPEELRWKLENRVECEPAEKGEYD